MIPDLNPRPIAWITPIISILALSATCKPKTSPVEVPINIEERFAEAMSLYENGQYAKAAQIFQSVAQSQRDGLHAYTDDAEYYLGMCFLMTGQFTEAKGAFEWVIKHASSGDFAPLAYIGLARAYLKEAPPVYRDQSKTTEEAISILETFLSKYPDHEKAPEAKALLSEARDRMATKAIMAIRVYENLMKYEAELHYADLCIQEFPESPLVWQAKLFKARALYFLYRDDEALSVLGEIESSDANGEIKSEAVILRNQILARKQ
ncbi:MAG: tetratricopeptide repeat protein [candidate division WOR-3 bacterium]